MTNWTIEQVKLAVEAGVKPIIICGSGTTTYSTDSKAPSWRALIQSGVQRSLDRNDKEKAWAAYAEERLSTNNVSHWLDVADEVTSRLGGRGGAELSAWLKDQVGNLVIKKPALYEAIFRLECPVATTNYDTLLTRASGRSAVSWTDADAAAKIIRGDDDSILHLHGIYSLPKSIILGGKSYEDIGTNKYNNIVRTFQSLACPSIFIGCSWDGVNDEDFTNIIDLLQGMSSAETRKYWLVKNGTTSNSETIINNFTLVEYGEDYDDLPKFLSQISPSSASETVDLAVAVGSKNIEFVEPKPVIFGREQQIEVIVKSLLDGGHGLISGAPGIGKTALAVTCLYDPRVIERFGAFRFFINLEKQVEPRAILSSTALALGLAPSGDDSSLLRQIKLFSVDNPFTIILDNAEDTFENSFLDAEKLLQLICQIDGVSVILTTRNMLPIIKNACSIDVLENLNERAATETFLTASGRKLVEDDKSLKTLLKALDGHALSLQLIAAQAGKARDLTELLAEWEQHKALLLKRRGQDEGRLTSVRASLAISFESKKLAGSPLARRLLTILSELPDGLNEKECTKILTQSTIVSKIRALEAINILRDLNLVENRPGINVRMLNPLRESIKIDHPILERDKNSVITKYRKSIVPFAEMNPPATLYKTLDSQQMNAESACRLAIDSWPVDGPLHELVASYLVYLSLSGRAIDAVWENLAKRFAQKGDYVFSVDIYSRLGFIELGRANISKAKTLYLKALPYTRQISESPVVGALYQGLANCARHDGDVAEAERLYKLALEKSQSMKKADWICIGNSYAGLGHLAYMVGNNELAGQMFKKVKESCELSKDVVGMANAISHLAKSSGEMEVESHGEALALIENHEFNASKSNFLISLGDYWFKSGYAMRAIDAYERAKAAARIGSHVMNEAHAQIRLGQALIASGRHNSGINEIVEGFELWFSTTASNNNTLEGYQNVREALVSISPMSALTYYSRALESWRLIGRIDLINDWINFKYGSAALSTSISSLM